MLKIVATGNCNKSRNKTKSREHVVIGSITDERMRIFLYYFLLFFFYGSYSMWCFQIENKRVLYTSLTGRWKMKRSHFCIYVENDEGEEKKTTPNRVEFIKQQTNTRSLFVYMCAKYKHSLYIYI